MGACKPYIHKGKVYMHAHTRLGVANGVSNICPRGPGPQSGRGVHPSVDPPGVGKRAKIF